MSRLNARFTHFFLVLAMILTGGIAVANDKMKADFAWFNQLGYPDTQDLPFIRYRLEPTSGPTSRWEYGFLLKEDDEAFDIINLAFCSQKLIKKTSTEESFHLEKIDLKDYAKTLLPPSDSRLGVAFGLVLALVFF